MNCPVIILVKQKPSNRNKCQNFYLNLFILDGTLLSPLERKRRSCFKVDTTTYNMCTPFLSGQMSQSTGTYVNSAILLSFAFLFVSVIGFTDVISSIIKKIITRFHNNPKDDNPKIVNICDDQRSCSSDKDEPEYNIQTVINQDFISTWL